jgi:hypothetical protein
LSRSVVMGHAWSRKMLNARVTVTCDFYHYVCLVCIYIPTTTNECEREQKRPLVVGFVDPVTKQERTVPLVGLYKLNAAGPTA